MNLLSRYLDDAYINWMGSAVSCCAPQLRDDAEQRPLRAVEKPMTILHHQPRLVPPPLPVPQDRPHTRSSSREWVTRTRSLASRASSRGSFSVKRRLNAYNGSRRPQIGAPTDFRHVQNALPRKTERFRPLELSIYMPENQLSPILPHFEIDDGEPTPPALLHVRSESALSNFSIPRKPLYSHKSISGRIERIQSSEWVDPLHSAPNLPESPSTQELMAALERELPMPPPQARLRSNTGPARIVSDGQRVAKVKSIMQEKLELEKRLRDIDCIIEERQSIYMSSRAGSLYAPSEEPMPDLSTAELSSLPPARPKTAPAKPTVHIPVRAKSFEEASSAFENDLDSIPPPPLPLVLTQTRSVPPLRKKKSFSRVSNWLFPSGVVENTHSRNISMDSVTNTPKPVTSREGFYQCVDLQASTRNVSIASVTTVSTLESEIDEPTVPTSWTRTPDSSPGGRGEELVRMTTFGEEKEAGIVVTREFGSQIQHIQQFHQRLSSVGVAF